MATCIKLSGLLNVIVLRLIFLASLENHCLITLNHVLFSVILVPTLYLTWHDFWVYFLILSSTYGSKLHVLWLLKVVLGQPIFFLSPNEHH